MLIKGQKVRIKKCDSDKNFFKLNQIVEVHRSDKNGVWLSGKDKNGNFKDWYYEYHEFELLENKKDKIVEQVIDKFNERSAVGIKKYGTTLDENNHDDFINHLQEELMDAILYLQKIKNIWN